MSDDTNVWTGTSIFNTPILAVRGNDGSVIMRNAPGQENDDGEEESANVLSLSPKSAASFAAWVKEDGR